MIILSNVDYFKELPFFNVSIEKPKIKRLKNIDLLPELPFYDQLNIIKTDQAFSGYATPLKNLSTIPAEFQWNSTGVMENYWKMTGTNGTSEIPLKFRWNSSSS